jgi:hypothetical protein
MKRGGASCKFPAQQSINLPRPGAAEAGNLRVVTLPEARQSNNPSIEQSRCAIPISNQLLVFQVNFCSYD